MIRPSAALALLFASSLTTSGSASITAPAAPFNLNARVVGSGVALTWIAPAEQVVAYVIEAGSTPGAANLANFSTGNDTPSFSAGGIGAGTYYVRVRARTIAATSPPSNEAVFVVGSGSCVVPGAPALRLTTNINGTVGFAWTIPSGNPATYILQAGSAPGLANLANSDLGSAATTFATAGVAVGTYHVRVRARNGCGTGAASNELTFAVLGGSPVVGPPAFLLQGWVWEIAPNSLRTYDFTQLAGNGVRTVEIRIWTRIGTLNWTSQTFGYHTLVADSQSFSVTSTAGRQESYDILDRNSFAMLLRDRRSGQQVTWFNCSAAGWPLVILASMSGCR